MNVGDVYREGHGRRLSSLTVTELFEELQLASAMPVGAEGEEGRRLRVDQIELELTCRDMRETLGELDAAVDAFADLFYDAPLAYLVLDVAGRVRRANRLALKLFGVANEDALRHQPLCPRLTAQTQLLWRRALARLARRQNTFSVLATLYLRQTQVPLRAIIALELDALGRPSGYRLVLTAGGLTSSARACVGMLRRIDALAGPLGDGRRALIDELVPTLADLAWWDQVSRAGALRCVATSPGPDGDIANARAAFRPPRVIRGGRTLQQQVQASGLPLLMSDCGPLHHSRPQPSVSDAARSLIILPVGLGETVQAVVTLIRRRGSPRFTSVDLALAEHIGERARDLFLRRPRRSPRAHRPPSPSAALFYPSPSPLTVPAAPTPPRLPPASSSAQRAARRPKDGGETVPAEGLATHLKRHAGRDVVVNWPTTLHAACGLGATCQVVLLVVSGLEGLAGRAAALDIRARRGEDKVVIRIRASRPLDVSLITSGPLSQSAAAEDSLATLARARQWAQGLGGCIGTRWSARRLSVTLRLPVAA